MNQTQSCSRMSGECQSCPDRDTCQNKRMEAMLYLSPTPSLMHTPLNMQTQDNMAYNRDVQINISTPSIEDLSKQINENMARKLNRCVFGELRR